MSASRRLVLLVSLVAALAALAAPAAQADFGIKAFTVEASNQDGSVVTQAGAHPYEYTVHIELNQDSEGEPEGRLRDLFLELPPGFVGNPLALPRCTRADFDFGLTPACPGNTQVGVADIPIGPLNLHTGVYNLTPTPGSPVTLGLTINSNNSLLDAVLRTGSDYGATISDITIPTGQPIREVTEHIWGLPMLRAHDDERLCLNPIDREEPLIEGCPSDAEPVPFLSMPTSCSGQPLETTLRIDSLQEPGVFQEESVLSLDDEGNPAPLTHCEALQFAPTIKARPQTAAADSPTGLSFNLHIPQNQAPSQLATAHLRDTVVTLPAGLAVNASAADGRSACSPAQIDLKGSGPANCPASSKIGTVEVRSPLVDHPLGGSVFLASELDNPFGSLLAIYVAVDDPLTGVVVKLAGEVKPDLQTGQLKATFKENPQLPFEDFQLDFFGGPRATLTTPSTCGTYTTQTDLTPWSSPEAPNATPSDSFAISEGAGGAPCPASEAQMPNAAALQAGTALPLAGAYSPFVLKVSRENGSQRLGALNVTLPPGLAAKLAGVQECSEPQIAAAGARSKPGQGVLELQSPSCPASSEVGVVNVGAGSGNPLYVQGHAYLAGPYKGAPLSLAIITPAVVGPFDLGVVVVRTALYVDESTAQVRAKSDPIPQILQGIPVEVRSVAIRLDRSQFALNPTNCGAKQIGAEAISPIGTVTPLSQHFQVAGCRGLEFSPRLKLSLLGRSQMRKTGHPALKAVLTQPAGQANISKAAVTLPATEFIDQFHISNPCTQAKFAEGACPAASVLGVARAYTPLLDKPLEGKVYFRANGGVRELPDVVADLGGQVHFILVGFVDSVGRGEISRTRNTFALVPDAPVSKFELSLYGGKRGLLENSANLCATTPRATVKLQAQNGRAQNTNQVVATSCKKKASRSRHHRGH